MIKNSIKSSIIGSIVGVLAIFALWFLLYWIVANAYVIPSPIEVIKASFLNFINGGFYIHLSSTVLRVIIALTLSFSLGVFLAVLSHLFKGFGNVMLPIVSVIRSLPVLAVLLIILVFVSRAAAPIIVCVLSILPIVYSQTLNYLNSISVEQREVLKVYKVPLKNQIFSVYLKGYFPLFIKESTTLFAFSLKLVVSAEILANVFKSIGGDISNAASYSNVTLMSALTLAICLIGLIVEFMGKWICYKMEKKFQ